MIPSKEELSPYVKNRKEAATKFGVTERTIINWLVRHELYEPTKNFGCGKLSMEKAQEIRKLHKDGAAMKDLAEQYHVTVSSISRILHNINYPELKQVADVSVVYNVGSSMSAIKAASIACS